MASIPLKCQKCAQLSAEQAQVLHGAEGDGRDIQASQETLERIGAALKLEPSETTHLLRLAGYQSISKQLQEVEVVSPQLQRVLQQLDFTPAYVLGRRWDILAWNDAATTLIFGDLSTLSELERNCLCWLHCVSVTISQCKAYPNPLDYSKILGSFNKRARRGFSCAGASSAD